MTKTKKPTKFQYHFNCRSRKFRHACLNMSQKLYLTNPETCHNNIEQMVQKMDSVFCALCCYLDESGEGH